MARASHLQTSFNGGEFSPKLEGRVDLARYAASCHELRNFIATISGPAEKRPGTHFVVPAIDHNSVFVPFEYSVTQAYIIEINAGKCRFFRNNGVVLETAFALDAITVGATTEFNVTGNHEFRTGDTIFVTGVDGTLGPRINNRAFAVTVVDPDQFTIAFDSTGLTATGTVGAIARVYEVLNPLAVADLPNLRWAQSADVLYLGGIAGVAPSSSGLTNGAGWPLKLLRRADNDWTVTEARGFTLGQEITLAAATNAVIGVFTTATAHGFQNGDVVVFSRVQGMKEVNGNRYVVTTVNNDKTFELSHIVPYPTDLNTTNFHAFGGGGKVAHTGVVQRVSSWAWPPFAAENLNENHLMIANGADGSVDAHLKGIQGVTLFSTTPFFTSDHVGTFVRLREIPEAVYTKWAAGTDFNGNPAGAVDDLPTGAIAVGDYVQWDGNVYELSAKLGGSTKTGNTPPTHDIEDEKQSDHRFEWQFAHQGDGLVEIFAVDNPYAAFCFARRRLPERMCPSNVGGGASTNTASPMQLTVTGSPPYTDGAEVILTSFAGAGGPSLNGLRVFVDQTGATTFNCYYDSALTRPVDGADMGGTGTGGLVGWLNGPNVQATHRWALEGWSVPNGYPKSIAFFEDRLCFAGTTTQPQTLWFSASGDYESHDTHEDLVGALIFAINDQDMNAVEWLRARRGRLVMGTRGGEFLLTGQNPDDPVSVENPPRPLRMTSYGVQRGVPPVQIGSSILFAQRSGRSIREFTYDEQNSDEYRAPDVSLLANHLFESPNGISQLVWHPEPFALLWAVTGDFEPRSCVFDRTQDVIGWSPHDLGGAFSAGAPEVRSVAVIPHPDADQDQLWMLVRRDGGTFVEYLEKPFRPGGDLATTAWYVDAGVRYSGAPATVMTGLDHLEGKVVHALADGRFVGEFTVSGGKVTLPFPASNAVIGLPFTAVLETSRAEAGAGDGTAQGKFKNVRSIVPRLHLTGSGLFYGRDAATMDRLVMRTDNDPTSQTPVDLWEGDTRELSLPGDNNQLGRVRFEHREPLPCTIVSLVLQLQVEDD